MAKESKQQQETVKRVMHEFKHGELESGAGGKVRNPRQAIAIGLREAGASNRVPSKKNREALSHTKAKERQGETAQQQIEGRPRAKSVGTGATRADLYAQAKHRNVPGRSRMTKDELATALAS